MVLIAQLDSGTEAADIPRDFISHKEAEHRIPWAQAEW